MNAAFLVSRLGAQQGLTPSADRRSQSALERIPIMSLHGVEAKVVPLISTGC